MQPMSGFANNNPSHTVNNNFQFATNNNFPLAITRGNPQRTTALEWIYAERILRASSFDQTSFNQASSNPSIAPSFLTMPGSNVYGANSFLPFDTASAARDGRFAYRNSQTLFDPYKFVLHRITILIYILLQIYFPISLIQ